MTWKSHRLLLGLPLLGFVALLILFALADLDLPIQKRFYDPASGMWPSEWQQPWVFLNLYGELPGLFLGLAALFTLLLSIGRPSLHPHRKIAAFLFSAVLLGPGLIVNGILKTFWGRPRPDAIIPFDGPFPFEPFLRIDPASTGGSFPSGHASMGFLTMVLGLLLLAGGRKRIGTIAIIASLLVGFFIGFSRIACGKHFVSDVLSAGFLVWTSTILLFFGMKMHLSLRFPSRPPGTPGAGVKAMRILSPVLITLIIAFATIKWPLLHKDELPIATPGLPDDSPLDIVLNLEGRLHIESGDSLHIRAITDGHGLAGARITTSMELADNTLTVTQARQGFFYKVTAATHLLLPPGRNYTVTLGEHIREHDTSRFREDLDPDHSLTILPHPEPK